jgi:peptidoglycan/LPS O-acetylase OafA/YrhL
MKPLRSRGAEVDSTTAAGVCDGSSDMTDGNAVQPASIARPPQAPLPGAKDAAGTGNRLAWLDVLRGLAALCVVFNHFGFFVPPRVQAAVYQWINPGDYGVFVFFIISGYIVPASLERNGSVRAFWVSRIFRLHPLYLLAIGLGVLLLTIHFGGLRGEDPDPETSVFTQLLMMSNVLAGKNLPNVVWSLSYEMIFYLLLTALFMARVHRRSGRYALLFAVAVAELVVLAFNGTWLWPWEARRTGTVPVLIAMCSLTYLLVERPMQNAGRRLARCQFRF